MRGQGQTQMLQGATVRDKCPSETQHWAKEGQRCVLIDLKMTELDCEPVERPHVMAVSACVVLVKVPRHCASRQSSAFLIGRPELGRPRT